MEKRKIIPIDVKSQKEAAFLYYKMIFSLYDIHLAPMHLNLLVYTALYGTISTPPAREAFLKDFEGTSKASMGNIISQLQKRKLLIKDKNLKIRVRPDLDLSFKYDSYQVKINFNLKEELQNG